MEFVGITPFYPFLLADENNCTTYQYDPTESLPKLMWVIISVYLPTKEKPDGFSESGDGVGED
jgi:hypothetical protein